MLRKSFTIILLSGILLSASSWGFLVHRTVNQLAIYELPKKMRPFFFIYKDYLVHNAPRPDQRRNTDPTEGNKHFIDMEYYSSTIDSIPYNWKDAIKKFSIDTLRAYGTLPYSVVATQQKLTNAFRMKNRDSILFYAADIGHYIADAHVPLHTSINYDGQMTLQVGIHDLWETTAPEIEFNNYNIQSRHQAVYLSSPTNAIRNIIRHTYTLLPETFAAEKEVSKKFTNSTKYRWQVRWGKNRRFYTSAFAKEYNKALQASINGQMIAAADHIADFWYTAWVDAGKPDLSDIMTKPYKMCEFKKERKALRKGTILEKGFLISRQKKTND
jgi:hypothetical protein